MDTTENEMTIAGNLLEESQFTPISSIGIDENTVEMTDTQKAETEFFTMKNNENDAGLQLVEFTLSTKQLVRQFDEKFDKMEKEMTEMGKNLDGLRKKVDELKRENEEFKQENGKMKEEMAEMKEQIVNNASLEDQIVGLKEKFDETLANLLEQIDSTQSKQIDAAIKFDSNVMKKNKWRKEDGKTKLAISQDGLTVKHFGPDEMNSVRAILPISPINLNAQNPSIISYYEVTILKKIGWQGKGAIFIGFSDQHFPLVCRNLEYRNNSIGICNKEGIQIEGSLAKYQDSGNEFKEKDVVGIGLTHSPAYPSIECFFTWNGILMKKRDLPAKFADIQLFPTVTLSNEGTVIRVNFGKEEWRFDPFHIIH